MRTFILFLPLMMLPFLFGQPEMGAAASIFDQVDQIKSHVEQENWDEALKYNEQIHSWFNKNNWKLQFLSYESEFQELERYISQLKTVLEERDKLQSKLIIESLKSTLLDIYRF